MKQSFESEMFQWRNCLFGKSLNEFSWQSTFNAPSPGHSCISSYMCNCTSENLLCWVFFLIENRCGYVLILNTVRIFSKSICGGFILCPLGSTVCLPCPLKLLILRFFILFLKKRLFWSGATTWIAFLYCCGDGATELQPGIHMPSCPVILKDTGYTGCGLPSKNFMLI